MESWKQSALLAVAVAVAMMIGGGLQAWSLGQAPDLIVPVVGPAPESDIAHGRARLAQENPAWSQFVAAVGHGIPGLAATPVHPSRVAWGQRTVL
jgi:hypothetical protein